MKKLIKRYQQGGSNSYADTLMQYAKQNPDLFFKDSDNAVSVRNWLRTNNREDILVEAYKNKGITDRTKMPLISSTYWQNNPVGGKDFMKDVNKLSIIPTAVLGTVGAAPAIGAVGGLVTNYVLPYVVPTTLSGGVRFVADGALGTAGSAITNGIVKKATGYNTWGEWLGNKLNIPKRAGLLEMTNPGGWLSVGGSDWYTKGVLKRGAETAVRGGDSAMELLTLPKKEIYEVAKPALKYVFNPFADKNLAYSLYQDVAHKPNFVQRDGFFRYSGNAYQSDGVNPFKGDMVDLYFNKKIKPEHPTKEQLLNWRSKQMDTNPNMVDNRVEIYKKRSEKATLPKPALEYMRKNYRGKPIRVLNVGMTPTESFFKIEKKNSKILFEKFKDYFNLSVEKIINDYPEFLPEVKKHIGLDTKGVKTFNADKKMHMVLDDAYQGNSTGTAVVDAAGHNLEGYSINPNTGDIVYNFYDFWKYNPKEYWKRYKGRIRTKDVDDHSPVTYKDKVKNGLYYLGLNLIDEQGSPIITRWQSENTFSPEVFREIIKPKYKEIPYKE